MATMRLSPTNDAPSNGDPATVPLPRLLEAWVAEGLITEDQRSAILRRERQVDVPVAKPAPPPVSSLASEALAYLGGVVILVGVLSLGAMYWDSLTLVTRLVLVGSAVAALLGAGALLARRDTESALRMRAVSWLAATVAFGGLLALVGGEALDWAALHVLVLTFVGTSVWSAALWYVAKDVLQQLTFFVSLMLAVGFVVDDVTGSWTLPGLAAWGVAVVWFLLGWGGTVTPRGAVLPLSGAAAVVATMTTFPHDAGLVLALVTAGALVGLAVAFRDLLLMAVGAVGLLQLMPVAIGEWFPDTVAAPFVLIGAGALLLILAIRTARRGRSLPEAPRAWTHLSSAAAVRASVLVALAVAVTILAVALA